MNADIFYSRYYTLSPTPLKNPGYPTAVDDIRTFMIYILTVHKLKLFFFFSRLPVSTEITARTNVISKIFI